MIPADVKASIRNSKTFKTPRARDFYIASMVNCWQMDGFASKYDAQAAYADFVTAVEIRRYFRKHGMTTRKGTRHSFDCTREHSALFEFVSTRSPNGSADGVEWRWRKVDYLRNLQIVFS